MRKAKELSDPGSCINRALPQEMVFVLLARDPVAPLMIRGWAMHRINTGKNRGDDLEIVEALRTADYMEMQRESIRIVLGKESK